MKPERLVSWPAVPPVVSGLISRIFILFLIQCLILAATPAPAAASVHAAGPAQTAVPGTPVAWGSNDSRQSTIPAGLTDVVAVAAGNQFSLALKADGTVVGWGRGSRGQLSIPRGLTGVIAIAAGGLHSLALKADGTLVGWGDASYGQSSVRPGLQDVTAIAAGGYHSLALRADGTVVAWGSNSSGQLEIPQDLGNVTAIAAGEYHSLALRADGTVVGWGSNSSGQTDIPQGLAGVTAIAAGGLHSLALKADGTVVAWGSNDSGQGIIPPALHDVVAVAAGGLHSLALTRCGAVVGWGKNDAGQATGGDGLAGLAGVTAIAGGGEHSLAINAPPDLTVSTPTAPDLLESPALTLTLNATEGLTGQTLIPDRPTALVGEVTLSRLPTISAIVGGLNVYCGPVPALTFTDSMTVPVTPGSVPEQAAGTLVFEPVPLPSAGDVSFELTIADAADPATVLARKTQRYTLDHRQLAAPNLYFVAIDFKQSGEGPPPFDLIATPNGDGFAAAVLPMAESNWRYLAANDDLVQANATGQIDPIIIPDDSPPCTDQASTGLTEIDDDEFLSSKESAYVLCRLSSIRDRIVHDNIGPTELSFVHGWIHDPSGRQIVRENGAATGNDRRVGYGTTSTDRGQLIYVHELLHNVGRFETGASGLGHAQQGAQITDTIGFDVGKRLLGTWDGAANGQEQRKTPYMPIMAHTTTAESWIAPSEYAAVLDYLRDPEILRLQASSPRVYNQCRTGKLDTRHPCLSENNFVFRGALAGPESPTAALSNDAAFRLAARYPVARLPWLSQPTYSYSTLAETPFRMQFLAGPSQPTPQPPPAPIPEESTPVPEESPPITMAVGSPQLLHVVRFEAVPAIVGLAARPAAVRFAAAQAGPVLFDLPFSPVVITFGADGDSGAYVGYFEINIQPGLLDGVGSMRIVNTDTGQVIDFLAPGEFHGAVSALLYVPEPLAVAGE